ncbi:MAG TPA: serine/threonine-protein kinase [Anaeromyxobacteraceae bacterium]|nr:serine/threonine-protein kinase [Anaeromyxobacteraceae bacterium]
MSTCTRCKREVASDVQFCPFCGAAAPPPAGAEPGDPWIGQTVAQKYLVHQLIDRGGMGVVYKATHLALDRPVALKMLNRALLADPTIVARFHREARAASRLNHPNSVGVIDFGQTDDGTLFIALEFLPGRNLARVIADDFPLGTSRVVKIGSQILAALTEAHALGILHCDIKPENVMLESRHDERDVVKVLDFGIAKLRDSAGSPRLTREGMVCGTPGYSSPEQARGEELDPRSDLYSVGVVLYELVAGKLPFDAATPGALLAKMLVERPVPLHVRRPDIHVPPDLEAVIMRALSFDREARYPSADHFRRELLACSATGERPARPMPKPQATAVFEAMPRGGPRTEARAHGPTPAPARTPARGSELRVPTPRHRPVSSTSRPAVREAAMALSITAGSVAGALLIGGLVWYGLNWIRGGGAEPPASLAVAPPEASPPPSSPAPRAPAPPQPAARPPAAAPGPPASPAGTTAPVGPGEGIVAVLGTPGAQISVDGKPAGHSPRELRLPPGIHLIRATHPDLGSAEESVEVVAGKRTLWNAALAK